MELPKKYDPKESEAKWHNYWKEKKLYEFDPKSRKEVFSIDTPPPTVSGKMHMGHAFSYSHQDFIARYQRMAGKEVYFPFGTDDNGLPTEKLVEKTKKVSSRKMPRNEFSELCYSTVKEILPNFIQDWINIGMSCDFDNPYSTISKEVQKISQLSFLELYEKGFIYQEESPISYCTKCDTAIAQAEFENIELESKFNDIKFSCGNDELIISTTRPELLPACVGLFAHPDDERYKKLKGKFAKVPLFDYEVPILFDEAVAIDKGTGLMMVCTFGDKEDVEKWHKHRLELRTAIDKHGKMNDLANEFKGLKIIDARKAILDSLKEKNLLINQKKIVHAVNVHERCGTEVEYMKSKQWYIKVLDKKHELLEAGKKIKWNPSHMQVRYLHWVENLNWDWCISRQRPFGIPFPVWREKSSGKLVFAKAEELPIDPLISVPKGYKKEDLEPETDVMDTWATSSITPQIVTGWPKNKLEIPMSLRPQAHDIIRTWAFYTIIKSLYMHNKIPWNEIMISGFVLDPKGKKMSKSKGNVIEPKEMMDKYSADALRFAASGTKLGEDIPFMEKELVTGQKTITKLWNASKFALMNLEDYENYSGEEETIDQWLVSKFNKVTKIATEAFDNYEYSKAKQAIDNFFWNTFCDYYLEIVKDRLYNPDKRGIEARKSAQKALNYVLLGTLKLFAPIMPHITEEIYHLYYSEKEKLESIHISKWPEYNEKLNNETAEKSGDLVVEILSQVRKLKSEKQMSLGAEIEKIIVSLTKEQESLLVEDFTDLQAACRANEIIFKEGKEIKVEF